MSSRKVLAFPMSAAPEPKTFRPGDELVLPAPIGRGRVVWVGFLSIEIDTVGGKSWLINREDDGRLIVGEAEELPAGDEMDDTIPW
jgi:hypothetical protein